MAEYEVMVAERREMPAGKDWLWIKHDTGVLLVVNGESNVQQTVRAALQLAS